MQPFPLNVLFRAPFVDSLRLKSVSVQWLTRAQRLALKRVNARGLMSNMCSCAASFLKD